MIIPGQLAIPLYRNQTNVIEIAFETDLTGATFEFTLRRTKAAGGAALLSLGNATAGSEGLSVAVVAGVPTLSTLAIQIDEATLDAIEPAASNGLPTGADVSLRYDLHINGTRHLEGVATISEGVTY